MPKLLPPKNDPKATVVWALMVTAVVMTAGKLARGDVPRPRSYISLLAVGMILSALSSFAPQVAAPLSVVVLLSTLYSQGSAVLSRIFNPSVTGPLQVGIFAGGDLPGQGGVGSVTGGAGGTAAVKTIIAAYKAAFPGRAIGGICTPGSVACSEHPFCNAVDLPQVDADSNPNPGNQVAAWAVGSSNRLPISQVIWNRRIWTVTSPTWRPYHGPSDHTDHVHISGSPLLSTCA